MATREDSVDLHETKTWTDYNSIYYKVETDFIKTMNVNRSDALA